MLIDVKGNTTTRITLHTAQGNFDVSPFAARLSSVGNIAVDVVPTLLEMGSAEYQNDFPAITQGAALLVPGDPGHPHLAAGALRDGREVVLISRVEISSGVGTTSTAMLPAGRQDAARTATRVRLPCAVLMVSRVAALPFTSMRTPGISIGVAGSWSGSSSQARSTYSGPLRVAEGPAAIVDPSPGRGCQLRMRRIEPPVTVAVPSHLAGALSLTPKRTRTVRTPGSDSTAVPRPPAKITARAASRTPVHYHAAGRHMETRRLVASSLHPLSFPCPELLAQFALQDLAGAGLGQLLGPEME